MRDSATNRLRASISASCRRVKTPRPSSATSGTVSSTINRLAIVTDGTSARGKPYARAALDVPANRKSFRYECAHPIRHEFERTSVVLEGLRNNGGGLSPVGDDTP